MFNIYAIKSLFHGIKNIKIEDAYNGKLGLEILEKLNNANTPIDKVILFLDLDMPIMNGYEVCN